jgi:hypothetical protein
MRRIKDYALTDMNTLDIESHQGFIAASTAVMDITANT